MLGPMIKLIYAINNISNIVVNSNNTVYDSRNNCNAIIETATNKLIAGCKNTIIPNTVTSIGDYAFFHCTGLTSINIPSGVTYIGNSAFRDCNNLNSITIQATIPPTLDDGALLRTTNCPIYVPGTSVDTYKAASGWSNYASYIEAIPT